MHDIGLHYYDPRKEQHLTFFNNVSKNKEGFTKMQIKGADQGCGYRTNLYKTLSYPSTNNFKWVIRRNQIKYCPGMVKDIVVALKVWGKNTAALKGKTTRRKSMLVAGDYVKVLMELMKLHKEVF
jgi:hypothetical protein